MGKINVQDSVKPMMPIMPVIYAATIPYDIRWKDGWLKIGEARKQSAQERVAQEGHEIDSDLQVQWECNAIYEGIPIEYFRDKDFHKYLKQEGIEFAVRRSTGNDMEVCKIESKDALHMLQDFRMNRGLANIDGIQDYVLRNEQKEAVKMAKDYADLHQNGEFLWNAKPRFGKTISTYDLAKQMKAKKVLIVTNRPAIANSWYDDYMKFIGRGEQGYFFVSNTDALKGKKGVVSYEDYKSDSERRIKRDHTEPMNMIYFVSLQDLKGSKYFGGDFEKLREVSITNWDMLVIDEAHEGVDTYKTDTAFNHIKRKFTLHLSGTPFKALSNEKFKSDAIFNWTYADEQKKKAEYANSPDNPYAVLPRLNMFTYQMSDIVAEKLSQGVEIKGETEEYAFDLATFFKTKEMANGAVSFVYNEQVDMFLNALAYQEKYPFSSETLRNELKHTLWLLDRVDSAKALAKKLENHEVFGHGNYKIVLAAGDGKIDDESETKKSYDKVIDAIKHNDKTITLSVGQLTTGVTIPEWTAVLMLSNISSPTLYMQAAFRAQNPHMILAEETSENGEPVFKSKENAYVFDFDPARTLTVFEQFANNLSPSTSGGGGTLEQRQQNIRELLNFFPVIGEDENGTLTELNVEQVLTIPRKIRSIEVVRRGFMSNFLFNINNVFNIPKTAMDIINQFEPTREKKGDKKSEIVITASKGFEVDDDGNVTATEEYTNTVANNLFGDKKYTEVTVDDISEIVEENKEKDKSDVLADKIATILESEATSIISDAQAQYGSDMRKSDNNQLTSELKSQASKIGHEIATDFKIKQNILEKERDEALEQIVSTIETANKTEEQINTEIEAKQEQIVEQFEQKKNEMKTQQTQQIIDMVNEFAESSKTTTVKKMEEKKEQRRATGVMEDIRARLRGFSRTIPSFIMAYCEDEEGNPTNITLDTFDKIVPDEVFQEVTSITLEQFRQLRDGFDFTDDEGNIQHFDGHVFDQVVFDDAIAEFISLKHKLANYFNENQAEDIFDYIPPQKTNQIYTPKNVVTDMVDYLEEENPGCFDDPDATFIDMYMKSGMYITEIVKRLFRSEKMKEAIPDDNERLQHIFDKQVYGLAPSKIIYAIATNYILGFAQARHLNINIEHFKELDASKYAQNTNEDGLTLQQKIDELFGK